METKGRTIASILIVVAISYCLLGITGMLPPQYDLIPKAQGTSALYDDFTIDTYPYDSAKMVYNNLYVDGNIWTRQTNDVNFFYKIDPQDTITKYTIPTENASNEFIYLDGYIFMWCSVEQTLFRFDISTEEFDRTTISSSSINPYNIIDSDGKIWLIDYNTDVIYKVSSDLSYTTVQISEDVEIYNLIYDDVAQKGVFFNNADNTMKTVANNGTIMDTWNPSIYFDNLNLYSGHLLDSSNNRLILLNDLGSENGYAISTFNYITNETTNTTIPYDEQFLTVMVWDNDMQSIWFSFDYIQSYLYANPTLKHKIVNYDFNQFWDFEIPHYQDGIANQISQMVITDEGYILPAIHNTKYIYMFDQSGEPIREILMEGMTNMGSSYNLRWNGDVLQALSPVNNLMNMSGDGTYTMMPFYVGITGGNLDVNTDNGDLWLWGNTYNAQYPQFQKITKTGTITTYDTIYNTYNTVYVRDAMYNEQSNLMYLYVNDNSVYKYMTWNPDTNTYGTIFTHQISAVPQTAFTNMPDEKMWITDARVLNNFYGIWKFDGNSLTKYTLPFYRERIMEINSNEFGTFVITDPYTTTPKNRIWKLDTQGVWTPLIDINYPTMPIITGAQERLLFNQNGNTLMYAFQNSTTKNMEVFVYNIQTNTTQFLYTDIYTLYGLSSSCIDESGNLWFDHPYGKRTDENFRYIGRMNLAGEPAPQPEVTQEEITLSYEQVGTWTPDSEGGLTQEVGNDITVRVHLESPDGIETAQIVYTPITDGTYDTVTKTVDMILVEGDNEDGYWEGDIPAQQGTGTLAFYVYATSETGGELRTPTTYVTITEQGQETPTPSAPSADLRTAFYAGSIGILLIVGVAINRPPARWRY